MKKITLKTLDTKLNKILKLISERETAGVIATEVKNNLITIKDTGKKTSELLAEYKSKFNVWTWHSPEELDKDFPPVISERKFKYEQECENRGKSANKYDKEGIKGITLREWIIFDMEYFKREGKHLDEHHVTLCTGKRYASGSVPGVHWSRDNSPAYLYRYNPGVRYGYCGVRPSVRI